ncbi:MAG: hypothetical protein CM1200mP29_09890 [Verrucomicrobiota bacterium]|nr:MAG: hypothetical protein CM1200mP29_09890 [Verrucomicrobiota bacterium]
MLSRIINYPAWQAYCAFCKPPKGPFKGALRFSTFWQVLRGLKNSGETVVLRDALGDVVDAVTYDDKDPWAEMADGSGKSLTRKNLDVNADSNDPGNWESPKKRWNSR